MKTKMTLIAVLIIGFVGIGVMACATEQKANKDAAATTSQDVEAAAALVQIQGVMEKSEAGLALFDGNDTYQLKGCENVKGVKVEDMIGKLVKISGDIEKNDKGAFINVKEVAVAN